ncbi:MAG: GNAT family N-acetyltransferase [Bacteroidia bacterium]|nr:GNAT family N-acetyltransferase [Bacteroidia bacterium]NNC85032.1 GNAT family N-acetyltransferase [Bacteroidia bacterium]NNM15173.1 GNAT family N-acetyltransferase [Bacteroidia bacterium]
MLEIKRFSFDEKTIAEQAFEVRRIVFVDEQKVSREEEFDEFEKSSHHYLALNNNQPVGTARWRKTNNGIKLERFAVLQSQRKNGIGKAILDEVLKDVKNQEQKIYLHAQLSALDFYKKAGFIEEGEHFWEANIEHVKMVFPA